MSEWVSAVSATADKKLAIKVTVNPPIHLDKLDLLFHVALEVSARYQKRRLPSDSALHEQGRCGYGAAARARCVRVRVSGWVGVRGHSASGSSHHHHTRMLTTLHLGTANVSIPNCCRLSTFALEPDVPPNL